MEYINKAINNNIYASTIQVTNRSIHSTLAARCSKQQEIDDDSVTVDDAPMNTLRPDIDIETSKRYMKSKGG